MKFSYKIVFFLFGISAVVPTTGRFKNKLVKYAAILFNTMILLFHAYDSIYLLYSLSSKLLGISFVIANFITLVHRYILGRRYNSLKKIANIMSKNYEIQEGRGLKLCVFAMGTLSIICHFLTLVTNLHFYGNTTHIRKLFGITDEINVLSDGVTVFYYFHHSILIKLPIHTFALFYALVSHHVRCLVKQFSERHSLEHVVDYQKLLQSLSSLHVTIESLDDKLSSFVLCLTLYMSYVVIFVVRYVLHYTDYFLSCPFCLDRVAHYTYVASSVFAFIAVATSASLVSEAYDELRTKARRSIISSGTDFSIMQQKILLCIEKEGCFTVFKIVQIKRSFIVYTFGGVITYMILFDNLLNFA